MMNNWTREDLPHWDAIRDADDMRGNGLRSTVIDIALDSVVEHLNEHHPKPTPGLLSSAADCVLDAEDRASAAKSEVDRWRRAHELVERERDQARHERDEARIQAGALVHDIEWHQRRMGEHCDDVDAAERERDAAVARAEQSERAADHLRKILKTQQGRVADAEKGHPAPAVTRDDIEKAILGKVWAANREPNNAGFRRVHIDWATDAVWSLVSGDDPAVHVIRESELPTLHPRYVRNFNIADGQTVFRDATDEDIAQAVVDVAGDLRYVIAAHRAIEAGADVDPVEAKARELAKAGGIDFDEQEPAGVGMLIGMARHVLGQEVGDE